MTTRTPSWCGVVVALAAGCAVHAVPDRSRPPVTLPGAFSAGGVEPAERWWRDFRDPALEALVRRGLAGNLDLRGAWARLAQAAAIAEQAGAARWPAIDAEAGGSRTRSNTGGMGAVRTNLFTFGLAAAYEVDLWGRVRSQARAAELDARASREDLRAAAISLAATIGDVWYALVEQRAQRALLDAQVKVSGTLLDLVELRFAQGQASALDVYQQRQQLASTRGQIPAVESRRQVLAHQLAVLVGRPPAEAIAPRRAKLPGLPPLPATGLPADLLTRRPDVRAAALRLAAADQGVAAAVADRLPALRLTGGVGLSSDHLPSLVDRGTWRMGAGVLEPIFDAGRRAAEVSRTKARATELLAAYAQSILTALREVEDALVQERRQRETLASIERQVDLANRTLRQARLRYANGLSDYLPVLAAVQALQRLERERVGARRRLISFRVQLYRALGGSWPRDLAPAEQGPASSATGDAP